MQTQRHIDITPKPIHISERKQRICSPILPNVTPIFYPSQNCLFFSFSPIKVIMCQRRNQNMMIMIMTVKTRRDSLWKRHRCKPRPRQLYPRQRMWHTRARNMLPYGAKRQEIKADPWTPRDSNTHLMWKGDTGVTAQYLLIAPGWFTTEAVGTGTSSFHLSGLQGLNIAWNLLWWLTAVILIQAKLRKLTVC